MKIKRILRYYFLKIVRLRDKPERIALSLAIGTSIMFLPFFGLGAFVAYFMAFTLKINRLAAVLTTIFWKWALVGFYILNLAVGKLVVGGKLETDSINHAMGFFQRFNFHNIGSAFLVGSVINAILSGILVYYVALKFLLLRKARRTNFNRHKMLAHKED